MFFRRFSFLLLIIFFSSCQFFTTDKQRDTQSLDTIVNFNKVDVSPSFVACDSLIGSKKTNCFRNTIHQKVAESLQKHTIKVANALDETIYVDLLIDTDGKITLKSIHPNENIQREIPKLDSLLIESLRKFPTIFPAIKRGIPVATQYQLPIRILLKE